MIEILTIKNDELQVDVTNYGCTILNIFYKT